MSERQRFVILCIALALLVGATAWTAVRDIESRLLTRAQAALAAEGIAFYDLQVEGRDIVVAADDRAPNGRLAEIVGAVPGVRQVRARLPTGRDDDASMPVAEIPLPIRLRIDKRGGVLTLAGQLSPAGARTLRAGLGSLASESADRLDLDPRVRDALDPTTVATIADMLATLGEPARITIREGAAVVAGVVETAQDEAHLRALAGTTGALRWSFELFVGAGGSG